MSVHDMLGKVLLTKNMDVEKGSNLTSLRLSGKSNPTGILNLYLIGPEGYRNAFKIVRVK